MHYIQWRGVFFGCLQYSLTWTLNWLCTFRSLTEHVYSNRKCHLQKYNKQLHWHDNQWRQILEKHVLTTVLRQTLTEIMPSKTLRINQLTTRKWFCHKQVLFRTALNWFCPVRLSVTLPTATSRLTSDLFWRDWLFCWSCYDEISHIQTNNTVRFGKMPVILLLVYIENVITNN